ncbi:MAG TPA: sugar isomerase [Bacteroidetes bacterium]|nr:SIS domain-containing protein [Ignavibacteria bacterium]HCA43954.1 sugar isomerase [Bacteroidota bacterium]HCN37829.1 sugar isomerase [Bacteroidota bacterium]
MSFTNTFLNESIEIINKLDKNSIENSVAILKSIRDNKGRLFIIGSGGGAGHASHACCDFRKICGLEAYSPSDNVSELTARVNDEGWDVSYVNWMKGSNFNSKDGVLVFSVGGGSEDKNVSMNLVNVIKYAKEIGAKVVGVVGKDGGYTAKKSDAAVIIPVINESRITPHTEGFQAIIWHLFVSHPDLQINKTKWESIK